MDGEVAECPLPAQLGIVVVDDGGVAPYRVHIAAQQPGPVDQGVDGVPLGRLWGGGSANRWDGIWYSDTGGTAGSWGWTEHDCCTGSKAP